MGKFVRLDSSLPRFERNRLENYLDSPLPRPAFKPWATVSKVDKAEDATCFENDCNFVTRAFAFYTPKMPKDLQSLMELDRPALSKRTNFPVQLKRDLMTSIEK